MKYTEEEILETILAREIQKELNKDILGHIIDGKPLESTPMKLVFDEDMTEEQINKWIADWVGYNKEVINRDIGDDYK